MEIKLFYYILNITIPFFFDSFFSVFKPEVFDFKPEKNLLALPKRHSSPQGGRGRQVFSFLDSDFCITEYYSLTE